MALTIKTTGLEQYAPGGDARVKVLVIGGPGVGKTRWSSYFPLPIYADCEKGLASVADRTVPFVDILTSQDMLDLLTYLKQECRQPQAQRAYQTVVVDTLDAFARKVKNEWMEKEGKQVFTGWEAWGYLNSRMQMLLTRLLNLDMNVIVLVHYKDKVTKDDVTGRESHELMPQLQGETADNIFNDFDLVAWMGTYWEGEEGKRVQKRGLSFKPTPDKPWLKDRLHVTPPWMEVTFAPTDYTNLFERIQSRIEEMQEGHEVGEIPSAGDEAPTPSGFVVAPGAAGSGALPAVTPREIPINQLDKPALIKRARDLGVTHTVDGAPIRANTNKGELQAALEAHAKNPRGAAPAASASPVTAAAAPAAAPALDRPAPVANPGRTRSVAEGVVNVSTGELIDQDRDEAVETVKNVLGAQVIGESTDVPAPEPAPVVPSAPKAEKHLCADCGKDLTDENPDIVKLSYIRFRKRFCTEHYAVHKTAGK